jgi:AraC-like DNA-binding protein
MRAANGQERSSHGGTASVVALRPMLAFARERGVDVDAILRDVGVPPSKRDHFDLRISESAREQAWVEAAERAHDPAFGLHVAERSRPGDYDVLDYSLCFSSTLGDALDRISHFHHVLCDACGIRQQVVRGIVRVRRIEERTPPPDDDDKAGFLVVRARQLTGVEVVPCEVRFRHAEPADVRPYAALFRCPVRFGQTANEMRFHARDLALPIKTANVGLVGVLDRYMTELMGRLPKAASNHEHIRSIVADTLRRGERPSLQATARSLRASERTVQRRLGEQGTTHREIVESVRRDIAERLVSDCKVCITEAAFLTGFADVSGFRRMYKRWTGVAPQQQRKRA